MMWSELKAKLDSYVLPLHDHEWVLQEVRKASVEGYAFPPSEEEILETLAGVSKDFIVGWPDPENDSMFMFGFKDGLYLDSRSLIDYIVPTKWEDIDCCIWATMESASEVYYNDEEPNQSKYKKEVDDFLTHLIGRSLCGPEPKLINSTSDCKKFIEEEYGYKNMKRTANNKWGNFNYRLFENDNGEEVSIVAYNGKLISHYTFTYKE